jgi:hypothetical protein
LTKVKAGLGGHDVSRVRPENAHSSDIFGQNRNHGDAMKTLAVISILALLTISGAAYTDQLRTGDHRSMQGAN